MINVFLRTIVYCSQQRRQVEEREGEMVGGGRKDGEGREGGRERWIEREVEREREIEREGERVSS